MPQNELKIAAGPHPLEAATDEELKHLVDDVSEELTQRLPEGTSFFVIIGPPESDTNIIHGSNMPVHRQATWMLHLIEQAIQPDEE